MFGFFLLVRVEATGAERAAELVHVFGQAKDYRLRHLLVRVSITAGLLTIFLNEYSHPFRCFFTGLVGHD
jgi:hypothetical protein